MGQAKTKGQIDYEVDVKRKPNYHDGTPRKQWSELDDIRRWSRERAQNFNGLIAPSLNP